MSISESVAQVWVGNFGGDEAGITISESGAGLDDISGKRVRISVAESVAETEFSREKVGKSISSSVGRLDASSSSKI